MSSGAESAMPLAEASGAPLASTTKSEGTPTQDPVSGKQQTITVPVKAEVAITDTAAEPKAEVAITDTAAEPKAAVALTDTGTEQQQQPPVKREVALTITEPEQQQPLVEGEVFLTDNGTEQPPAKEEVAPVATGTDPQPTEPTLADCVDRLNIHITESKKFLGGGLFQDGIDKYGEAAETMTSRLIGLGCEPRLALEFSVLTLYDLVIFIDDSTSMRSHTNKEILKKTLTEICDIYNLANDTGIKSVRYVNSSRGKKDVSTAPDIEEVIKRCASIGLSRIGTELHKKIVLDFVLKPGMVKPLLVIIIASGKPVGENQHTLQLVISECFKKLNETNRSEEYVAFEFCRIGDGSDRGSVELFQKLDEHMDFGANVDLLPEVFDLKKIGDSDEKAENKWNMIAKLLLGAIVPHWDQVDENILTKEDLLRMSQIDYIDD